MLEIYESYGINWMWYLEVERIDEDTVRFVREYRVHKFEDREYAADRHPKNVLGEYQFAPGVRDSVYLITKKPRPDSILMERVERFQLMEN